MLGCVGKVLDVNYFLKFFKIFCLISKFHFGWMLQSLRKLVRAGRWMSLDWSVGAGTMVYQPMVTLSTCTMRAGRFFGRGMFWPATTYTFPPTPTPGGTRFSLLSHIF